MNRTGFFARLGEVVLSLPIIAGIASAVAGPAANAEGAIGTYALEMPELVSNSEYVAGAWGVEWRSGVFTLMDREIPLTLSDLHDYEHDSEAVRVMVYDLSGKLREIFDVTSGLYRQVF